MTQGHGTEELAAELSRLFGQLDHVDYYRVLGIDPRCDYLGVRDAFYARAQQLHPDRFVQSDDESVRRAAYAVYKRMTEAYGALSDPDLRRTYDEIVAGGGVRLPPEARARRLDPEERQISNPFARMYLRSARAKFDRGELNASLIDTELGLSLEEAGPLRELHERIMGYVNPPTDPS
jgi:curved DNA-binding protein CbpA